MRAAVFVMVTAALLFGGCTRETRTQGSRPATVAGSELTPEQLGSLGARIRQEPETAGALLEESGMDRDQFETAIRRLTEDPEASKRYARAFEEAGGNPQQEITSGETAGD
jgi:hypothetical protein